MGSLNFATLFAQNHKDSFIGNLCESKCHMFLNSNRMDHVSAVKLLVIHKARSYQPEIRGLKHDPSCWN